MTAPTMGQVIKWLLRVTRPVHAPLLFSTLMRCLNLLLDIALFASLGAATVLLIQGRGTTGWLFAGLAALAMGKAISSYLEQFSGHYVAFKALELLRTYLFSALWPKYPYAAQASHSGHLVASLTRDVDRVEVVYAHTFAPVIAAYVVPTIALSYVGGTYGWGWVGVAALCVLVSVTLVPMLGVGAAFQASRDNLRARHAMAAHLTDTVYGLEEVIGYGREGLREEEVRELEIDVAKADRRAHLWVGMRRAANLTLMLLTAMSVAFIPTDDPVLKLALLCGALRLFEAPRGIEDAVGQLDKSYASARRLFQIQHLDNPIEDGPTPLAPDGPVNVDFVNVEYRYPNAEPTQPPCLSGATLHVAAGTHAVIRGRSGLGKTTLLKLLLRFDDPQAGRIQIDGVDLTQVRLDDLRRTVAMVSQNSDFIDGSIRQNLALAEPQADEAQMWQALEAAGLAAEVKANPAGLDTRVGAEFLSISGGQARRLDLARALLRRPRLLLLDEFTAGLNGELEAEIRVLLRGLLTQMTIIEVCHDLQGLSGHENVVDLGADLSQTRTPAPPGDAPSGP